MNTERKTKLHINIHTWRSVTSATQILPS